MSERRRPTRKQTRPDMKRIGSNPSSKTDGGRSRRTSSNEKRPRSSLPKQPRPSRKRRSTTPANIKPAAEPEPPKAQARKRSQLVKREQPVRITPLTIMEAILSARVLSFVLFSLCVATLVLATRAPGMYLREFDVQGLTYLNPGDIISASNLEGTHVLTANPARAIDEILKLPGVVAAELDIHWPGNVTINIDEEKPVAIWEQDGLAYWVNEAGHLLPLLDGDLDLVRIRVDEGAGNNMPITVPDSFDGDIDWPDPRTRLIPPNLIANARELASVHEQYNELLYSASHGLTWYHPTVGWYVYFGSNGDMRVKAAVLDEILLDMDAKEIAVLHLDISNPEMVKVKPVEQAQAVLSSESPSQP